MKKYSQVFCCTLGGSLIGFWAKSLDTVAGCLFFTLGVILISGSFIWIGKRSATENEKNEFPTKRDD